MSRSTHSTAHSHASENALSNDATAGGVPVEAPVTLPYARIIVEDRGRLRVTVDGEEYPPPEGKTSWVRADLGGLLDAVTEDRSRTVRVEISETDGTTFTDIIQAAPRRTPPRSLETTDRSKPAGEKSKPSKKPPTIQAAGFAPGESVAVAVVASEAAADEDGTAEITVPKGRIKVAEIVLLYGRASGRVELRGLV
ncbi:hypothetical protein [Nesterenkonia alkaliphila]|uniref:Uncharacterized protein n=1 Tax=Nesterenkonia alkaliphila TaxID=1463631 RepID=A0A7K1UM99_9MICC|nr:hypothetical protein [Nesterenkonia alkaliphila]MVT27432.1 hypothetical protein [Nesterenkonia alkaliphila]